MKGIIFNLVESFIVDGWGIDAYEAVLDQCDLETKSAVFVGPGTYPDTDLLQIVGAAASAVGLSVPDALRAFGCYAFPRLIEAHPRLVDQSKGARDLLLILDGVVHVQVVKLYPDAVTPEFEAVDTGPDTLSLFYRSSRQLCPLIEGFFDGMEAHFGEVIHRTKTACLLDGAPRCAYELRFEAAATGEVA